MKIDDAMKLNDGWFKIVNDPNMETDFWPPNDEIAFIEIKKDLKEIKYRKYWNECYKKIVDMGFSVVINEAYMKNINLIPVEMPVEIKDK